MAHDVKTDGYGCVCVCVCVCVCGGWGVGGSKSTSHAPLTPPLPGLNFIEARIFLSRD